MSEWLARWIRLGSMTITNAPFSRALMMRDAIIGWFSVVLEPVTRMQVASSSSGTELVIAPLPKAWARPVTVGAWQSLAQWSMLLVPTTPRANFIST